MIRTCGEDVGLADPQALVIAIAYTPGYARIVRAQVLSVKEQEYVLAAIQVGVREVRILVRHVFPNVMGPIIVAATLGVANAILTESALSFLGIGVQPPTPSWGELLAQGWNNLEAWWISGSVVAAMTITLISVTFTGEAIREAFDPKLHTVYE